MHFSALVISFTWRIGSCILSEVMGALDRQSATTLVGPGMYCTTMSYGMVFIRSHCICGEALSKLLLRIDLRGFCSVSSVNCHPYKK